MSDDPAPSAPSAPPAKDFRHDARHRVLGYLLARGVVDRRERERWLERLFAEVESEDRLAFGSPQATVKAIDAYERLTATESPETPEASPRRFWLPSARFKPMPRQPLGDLPVVLRGSFWSRTARWAWPRRASHPDANASPSTQTSADLGESVVD
ncbi:MAG: hypothetical protein AAGH92_10330 [Planctomycetota bacterium]